MQKSIPLGFMYLFGEVLMSQKNILKITQTLNQEPIKQRQVLICYAKTGKNCLVFQAVANGMKALPAWRCAGIFQPTRGVAPNHSRTKKDETSPSEMDNL